MSQPPSTMLANMKNNIFPLTYNSYESFTLGYTVQFQTLSMTFESLSDIITLHNKVYWGASALQTSNGSWRQGIKGKYLAQSMSHCYGILIIEYVFESH